VLPCRKIKVDPVLDAKDPEFKPNEGFADFDKLNWDMCKSMVNGSWNCADIVLDDVERFADSPITIQLVARPFKDEELLNMSEVVDNVINA
jgi:Asp-tRNA(Asn)/Glu-tRNA(Gln) amidotransferase A subunit family amidase